MLEAADCKQTDVVSPFFEGTVGVSCKKKGKALGTVVFTLYFGLVNKWFERNGEPGRTKLKLSGVQSTSTNSGKRQNRFLQRTKPRHKNVKMARAYPRSRYNKTSPE